MCGGEPSPQRSVGHSSSQCASCCCSPPGWSSLLVGGHQAPPGPARSLHGPGYGELYPPRVLYPIEHGQLYPPQWLQMAHRAAALRYRGRENVDFSWFQRFLRSPGLTWTHFSVTSDTNCRLKFISGKHECSKNLIRLKTKKWKFQKKNAIFWPASPLKVWSLLAIFYFINSAILWFL